MIPSAIFNGLWVRKSKQLEFSILEFNKSGFSFRAIKEYRDALSAGEGQFLLRFFRFSQADYIEVDVDNFALFLKEETLFSDTWQVQVRDNPSYEQAAVDLTKEYMGYVHLYLEEEPESVSEKLTGYPAGLEERYPQDFTELKKDVVTAFESMMDELHPILNRIEQGIVLDAPWMYERYLEGAFSQYVKWYKKEAGSISALIEEERIGVLYFGSQVCWNLMPDEKTLISLLKKCLADQKKPVIQFPPVKEHQMKKAEALLNSAEALMRAEQYTALEVVLNDMGTLALAAKRGCIQTTMGILLLKQKKDPRYIWKKGTEQYLENTDRPGWINRRFWDHVRDRYQVSGYMMESCTMNENCLKDKNKGQRITVLAPWYQMNTSTLCPLYAAVKEGDRGRQQEADDCGILCKEHAFLYPSHLRMCGRYNSIWGYDADSLKRIAEGGADRLVWNFNL